MGGSGGGGQAKGRGANLQGKCRSGDPSSTLVEAIAQLQAGKQGQKRQKRQRESQKGQEEEEKIDQVLSKSVQSNHSRANSDRFLFLGPVVQECMVMFLAHTCSSFLQGITCKNNDLA